MKIIEKFIAFLAMAAFMAMALYFVWTNYYNSEDNGGKFGEIKSNLKEKDFGGIQKIVKQNGGSSTSFDLMSDFITITDALQCCKKANISLEQLLHLLGMYDSLRENCHLRNHDCGRCNRKFYKGM